MEIKESSNPSGYGKPPWIFRGSALYQLHLVKAETARAFIPKEFSLVEAFGYTLGGFFLANYEDSPAGTFDELVVIAGIVWNPPTSCAWAARVLVDSKEACNHGRKAVGLPSQVARFSKKYTAISREKSKISGFLDMIGMSTSSPSQKNRLDLDVSEIEGQKTMDICNISLGTAVPEPTSNKWMGPMIKMSLPSFSGRTKFNPHLLKYSCQIECRIRAVTPAKVSGPSTLYVDEEKSSEHKGPIMDFTTGEPREHESNLSISVMLSKPILALQFNCLKMKVEAPTVSEVFTLSWKFNDNIECIYAEHIMQCNALVFDGDSNRAKMVWSLVCAAIMQKREDHKGVEGFVRVQIMYNNQSI